MLLEWLAKFCSSSYANERICELETEVARLKEQLRVFESQAIETIKCPACKKVSYNLYDVKFRYCGSCHMFLTSDLATTTQDYRPEELLNAIHDESVTRKPEKVVAVVRVGRSPQGK